jgi:hypothetical protein
VLFEFAKNGLSVWFGVLTAAFALPLLYFVVGSLYQLFSVFRLSWRFHRHTTLVPSDELPVETSYPVKLFSSELLHKQPEESPQSDDNGSDSEGVFFAAAYADPFGRAILLTEYTVEQLSEQELAAVISHEESHLKYRGAQLQFLFATLPVFGLMGKNVVYSIYDFFHRELTADQYAYLRLASRGQQSPGEPLRDALLQFESGLLPFTDKGSIGFLPTMLSVPDREIVNSRIEQWFELFYGNFAGDVHPNTDTRRRVIYLSENLPVSEQDDPEDRAGLMIQELKNESK